MQRITDAVVADSVLGVTLFGDSAPDNFQRFDKAFVTMFRIAGPASADALFWKARARLAVR